MQGLASRTELMDTLAYDPDSGDFTWRVSRPGSVKAGDRAGGIDSRGYRVIKYRGRRYLGHRLAWLFMTGCYPRMIDHADGDRQNNEWSNIREADPSQNACNRRRARGGLPKTALVARSAPMPDYLSAPSKLFDVFDELELGEMVHHAGIENARTGNPVQFVLTRMINEALRAKEGRNAA